jgi:macrodomain Ter protein organizer (MatP/YcbG family)
MRDNTGIFRFIAMPKSSSKKPPSLIEQMKQATYKPETSRFTIDLEADRKQKLEILAQQTKRTKSSVIKFLIDAAYAQLETETEAEQ